MQISAEFRPRFELNHGFGQVPLKTDVATAFVSQRTRLNVSHKGANADFYFGLQDIRVWGDENQASRTSTQLNTLSLGIHQAWVGLKLSNNDYLKIGRQEFHYDDQRLLSARNWPQYGQTYDALLFRRQKNEWLFDLAVSYNNDATKQGSGFGNNYFLVDPIENRIRTLNFAYLKRNFGKNTYLSGLAILSGYQKEKQSNTIYMMATLGGHFNTVKKNADFKSNFYVQRGKSQKGKDMHSYFFTAEGGYRIARTRLGFGVDVLSGNDGTNTRPEYLKREHSFDLLYGVRYLRHGRLNQYVLPSSTSGGGWVDIYPSISRQTKKFGTFLAEWHSFYLHRPVVNPLNNTQVLKGSLGGELNLVWNYDINKYLNLNAGFARYWANDNFAYVKKVEPDKLATPWWGWLMLTYKPVLFSSEK